MGGESLDAQLEPIAQFLLVVIVMMVVAAVSSYAIMKITQRRKEKAHNKLSSSRRGKDTGINLFGEEPGAGDASESRRSEAGRSARKGSRFNLFTFLKQLAYRLEAPKSRRRGKGRRRRTGSSSDNLRIDILKKPDAQKEPPLL